MPSPRIANAIAAAREKLFLALIVTLAVAQLIAFWMLCDYQVQHAQARGAGVQVLTAAPRQVESAGGSAADENTPNADAPAGRGTRVNFSVH
jgi:hypothetical protein